MPTCVILALAAIYVSLTIFVLVNGLNRLDLTILRAINSLGRVTVLDKLSIILTRYGRFYTWGLIDLVLLILRLWVPFLELSLTLAIAYVLGGLTRILVRRPRPHDAGLADSPYRASGYSYPSGHAAIVFGGSFTMLLLFGGLVSIVFFIEAILVSAARLYLNAHYTTDIVGGVVLGALSAALSSTLIHYIVL